MFGGLKLVWQKANSHSKKTYKLPYILLTSSLWPQQWHHRACHCWSPVMKSSPPCRRGLPFICHLTPAFYLPLVSLLSPLTPPHAPTDWPSSKMHWIPMFPQHSAWPLTPSRGSTVPTDLGTSSLSRANRVPSSTLRPLSRLTLHPLSLSPNFPFRANAIPSRSGWWSAAQGQGRGEAAMGNTCGVAECRERPSTQSKCKDCSVIKKIMP